MRLGWNAIVKNEAAIIERCVASLLPHVDCAIIADTGSTDGTPDIVRDLFAKAGKPVEIATIPFVNFEASRNAALNVARHSPLAFDYLLLCDADMELQVTNPNWINGHSGRAYDMRQVAGGLHYYNRRLVAKKADGRYVGVTHEYFDSASDGTIDGAFFVDHADGANRADKFARDIALIEAALATETRPSLIERYEFYLAQSYFDAGNWEKAAEHYRKRVALGGFEEERWNAQLHYAHCLDNMGRHAEFLWEMLQAYAMRPSRAETLYDLAKYFRERPGEQHISLLFSDAGLRVPYPKDDRLFVNGDVYSSGLKEEFAICAWYAPIRRRDGAVVCDELALGGSGQAKANLYWYLEPLKEHVPSFAPKRIDIPLDEGWAATNPSVINWQARPQVLLRAVNYRIDDDGRYIIRGTDGGYSSANPIRTRNYLADLSEGLEPYNALEIAPDLPPPAYDVVRGFEDSRLFEHCGEKWILSAARELNPEGWSEQVLAPLRRGTCHGWQVIHPDLPRQHEKNWMPWVKDGQLLFVYRLDTLLDATGKVVARHPCPFDVSRISGGSQVVYVSPETYLALVHEARLIPGRSQRYYQHRFVRFRRDGSVAAISQPFVFHDRTIEFAAGLAYFPMDRQLVASYGVMDREAWLARMDLDEVLAFVGGAP
jgi:glycosyltransferase involved in cell wall biosynthesis